MYLPIGLFGVSIATAAIPGIATHAVRHDMTELRRAVSRGFRMMLMLNVPATFGLIALASPIIALIFERGQFTGADTAATASALIFYAPGLVGYSAVKIASPVFYALHDSRTPVTVSVLTMTLNVVLNLTLVRVMGYPGLALGTAVAAIVNASVLFWRLRGRLGGLEGRRTAVALGKILIAAAAMAASAWAIERALGRLMPDPGTLARAGALGAAIAGGLVVLGAGAHLLHISEFDDARRLVLARFRRRV
jgi:putative peptidoglycan lipid II flippase